MVVDIPDVVKYASFGDHRLRGFWVAVGHISPSPIDFYRRPYNTLALACERVMWVDLFRMRAAAESCPCSIQSITMGRSAEPSAGVQFSGAAVKHGVSVSGT